MGIATLRNVYDCEILLFAKSFAAKMLSKKSTTRHALNWQTSHAIGEVTPLTL